MKKLFSVLAGIMLLFSFCTGAAAEETVRAGSTVTFGRYPQFSGEEPIEWTVLEVREGKALLLSRYLLDMRIYYPVAENTTWEKSSIRKWLNSGFLDAAFSEAEQTAILLTDVDNSDAQGNPEYERSHGGCDTQDRLFLLSFHEAFDLYFSGDEERICPATDYAVTRSTYSAGSDGAGWWWLRSPGYYQSNAAVAGSDGTLRSVENKRVGGGIRPALWVDTGSAAFLSGLKAGSDASMPEKKGISAADLAGTWFGMEMDDERVSGGNSDFRMLRFDPEGNRLDMLRSNGYYPEYYSGTYRVEGNTLIFTQTDGEYSYDEEININLLDGKLLMNWYGRCALSRVSDGLFQEDPEASPYLGENRKYIFSAAENGSLMIGACLDDSETVEVPGTILDQPVTEIGSMVFSSDTYRHIILPDGITNIGSQAFSGAGQLESVRLPPTLVSIQYNAFEYCRGLTKVVIPEGTKFIGSDAFMSCDELRSVILPESLEEMEDNPFSVEDTNKILFRVKKGSYAESWCLENGIKCRALDETEWEQLLLNLAE